MRNPIEVFRKKVSLELDFNSSDIENPDIPPGIKATQRFGLSNDELAEKLLGEGKPCLIAGLSLIGEQGHISFMVALLQFSDFRKDGKARKAKGWNIHLGQPARKSGRLCYLDTSNGIMTELTLPNTMTYLVTEVDPDLVTQDADKDRLQRIVDYAMKQIHD